MNLFWKVWFLMQWICTRSLWIPCAKKSTPKPTNGKLKTDPFDYVKGNAITGYDADGTNTLRSISASLWTVCMAASAAAFVISVIVCGLWLAANPNEGKDVKQHFLTKAGIFILICGGVFFLSLCMEIGMGFIIKP